MLNKSSSSKNLNFDYDFNNLLALFLHISTFFTHKHVCLLGVFGTLSESDPLVVSVIFLPLLMIIFPLRI